MDTSEYRLRTIERDVHRVEKLAGTTATHNAVQAVQIEEHAARIKATEHAADKIGSRLTRLEIAIAVLVAVTASPKLGGPSLPQVTASVIHLFS